MKAVIFFLTSAQTTLNNGSRLPGVGKRALWCPAACQSPQIIGDTRGLSAAACVCVRALVRVCKRVCLYMNARVQIHSRVQIKIPFFGDRCTTSKKEATT